jgi:hypothetical protein
MEDRTLLSLSAPFAAALPVTADIAPSPPQNTTRQTLADLPAEAQNAVSAAMGKDSPAYAAAAEAGGLKLSNPAQRFSATLSENGLSFAAGADSWRLALDKEPRTTTLARSADG